MTKAVTLTLTERNATWFALEDRGQPFSICLGRGEESDLIVPYDVPKDVRSTVSRIHARFSRYGTDYWIEDMGSVNFTYVDGQIALWPMLVRPPCTIRLGELSVRVEEAEFASAVIGGPDASAGTTYSSIGVTRRMPHTSTQLRALCSKGAGKFRLAGVLLQLSEFVGSARRADDAEHHLKQVLSAHVGVDRIDLFFDIAQGRLVDELVKRGVAASFAEAIRTQIDTAPPTDPLLKVLKAEEHTIAWIMRDGAGTDTDEVYSIVIGRGEGGTSRPLESAEADIAVGAAVLMAGPLLRRLRELEKHRAAAAATSLREISGETVEACNEARLWGGAASFRKSLYYAEQAAKRYLPARRRDRRLSAVFILGESGTGKSVLARLIHQLSNRSGQPFEELNCSAIPVALAESELFGYERGAHDTAFTSKPGIFESVANGTLFLDEIGKTSRDFQAKLLTVLDTGAFRRLGGKRSIETKCYVILAASEDPLELCKRGLLLEELWFRTGAFTITLPSLRDRNEDIPMLISRELDTLNAALPPEEHRRFSRRLREAFESHDWPGNARQLLQYVDVAHALAPPRVVEIDLCHLPAHMQTEFGYEFEASPVSNRIGVDNSRTLDDLVEELEREYLVRSIVECKGNLSEVSRRSGKSYQTVYNKLRRFKEWAETHTDDRHNADVVRLRAYAGPYWRLISSEEDGPLSDHGE